ncbi:DnaJ domain protein [Oesophagostomum dentatum]|uniref:DnaJ domain protein n=1 Tax=Oesophagostomum dentatum TaxID=61180 RepID=A0A0B1SXW4_OESDE|nr:DnaJ domain protein [Oesophagostomum dentatum]
MLPFRSHPVYCLLDDYYDVLGVDRHASKETIRTAYHARARLWHPDKNADSEQSKEKFVQLQRAYAVLSDPHKRTIYDRVGTMGLDVADRYSEDQRPSMTDVAGDSKWAIYLTINTVLPIFECWSSLPANLFDL